MRQRTKLFLLSNVILGIFVIGINTFAADSYCLLTGIFDANSRKERVEIAKDILSKIELLDSYLPNPKPSEVAWIKEERAAMYKLQGDAFEERFKKLSLSPEYTHQYLKEHLAETKTHLECIINDKVNLESEILCWERVSLDLSERNAFDSSIMILKIDGRLPKDIAKKACFFNKKGFSWIYDLYAWGIHMSIIIPYLEGHIK